MTALWHASLAYLDTEQGALAFAGVVLIAAIPVIALVLVLWDAHQAQKAFRRGGRAR
jgi:hypothetical protein